MQIIGRNLNEKRRECIRLFSR